MSSPVQLINDWIRHNALPVSLPWAGPRASITFDSVRVHLTILGSGQILIEARICDLPALGGDRERTVFRLTQIALARMRDNPAALSIDEDGAACWLQRRMAGTIQRHELDEGVESLINEVERWRAAL
ncbi:MAG: hypothetical protein RL322_1621 [Pseudomonadota bacterium]|jgi:hypothetical protein